MGKNLNIITDSINFYGLRPIVFTASGFACPPSAGRLQLQAYACSISGGINKDVEFLSGGNQQKTVIAKWLATEPRLLILNDPTRGIDIGSRVEIYSLIGDLALQGLAILFTSSELDEIIGLCHKIYIFYKGRIIKF